MVVLRTVKNGKIKIKHKYYAPIAPYDGRFEGKRLGFGVYDNLPPGRDFVCLWGTKEMFEAKNKEEYDKAWDNNYTCENGIFKWVWWDVKWRRSEYNTHKTT